MARPPEEPKAIQYGDDSLVVEIESDQGYRPLRPPFGPRPALHFPAAVHSLILGLGAGIMAGGWFLESHRYYRE